MFKTMNELTPRYLRELFEFRSTDTIWEIENNYTTFCLISCYIQNNYTTFDVISWYIGNNYTTFDVI